MDDARLNQILEETMSLLGNQFPGLMEQLQNPSPLSLNIASNLVIDLSNSMPSGTNPQVEEENSRYEIDISNGLSSFEHDLNLRKYQLLETLSSNWFKHSREYHDIMYQMNTISQRLMQNIISETRISNGNNSPPPLRYNTRTNPFSFSNGIDVGGFSFPIRRVPVFESAHSDNESSYPNIRQIVSSTEIFNYNADTNTELSCPITLEEFENGEELCRIRYCRHVFKWKYLQEWFCTNSHCPVCRFDIRTYASPPTPTPTPITPPG